jgi:hypothetical protein
MVIFKCFPQNAVVDGRVTVYCLAALTLLLLMFLSIWQLLAACVSLHQQ